jgi:hypothetical protein
VHNHEYWLISKLHRNLSLQFWVVALGCALLTIFGFTLEVALRISNRNGASRVILGPGLVLTRPTYHVGFDVPPTSISSTKIWMVRSVSLFHLSHLLSCAADCSWAQSHSSPLSFSPPLPSWCLVSIGPSECGMCGDRATCSSLTSSHNDHSHTLPCRAGTPLQMRPSWLIM